MSCVHYKFSSKLNYDTVTFDGLHITVSELKKQIMGRERLKASDCDLQITNAQTKEEYTDDAALIPKNSSVIIRRIPIGGVKAASKTFVIDRSEHSGGSSKAVDDVPSITLAQLSKTANLAEANASEEDKIRAMMSQSNHDYDPIHYTKKLVGPPPPNYTCFRCGKTGHYIRNCPTNGDKSFEAPQRIKRSTGIPRSFMMEVDDPSTKGAMLTNTGTYAIPTIDAEAYAVGKKEKPPFVPQDRSSSSDEDDPVPDELLCLICKDLMTDAVVIPCCGNSYCDDCIRTSLLESEEHICPTCSQAEVSPDALIANKFLRQAVNNFRNETGYTKRMRKSAAQPSGPAQKFQPRLLRPIQPLKPINSRQQDPLRANTPPQVATAAAPIPPPATPASQPPASTTPPACATPPRSETPPATVTPSATPPGDETSAVAERNDTPPPGPPTPPPRHREDDEATPRAPKVLGASSVLSDSLLPTPVITKGHHVPVLNHPPSHVHPSHSIPHPRSGPQRPSAPRAPPCRPSWEQSSARSRHQRAPAPPVQPLPVAPNLYPPNLFPPPQHGLAHPPGVAPPAYTLPYPQGQPAAPPFNMPPPGFPPTPASVPNPWVPPGPQPPIANPPIPAVPQSHFLSEEEFYRKQRRLKEEEKSKLDEFTNDFAKELLEYRKIQKDRRRSYSRSKSPYRSPYSGSSYSYSKSRSRSRTPRSYSRSVSRSRSRSRSYTPYSRRGGRGRSYRSRSRSPAYRRSRTRSPSYRGREGAGVSGAIYRSRSRSPIYRTHSPAKKLLPPGPPPEDRKYPVPRYREAPVYDAKAYYGHALDESDPFERERYLKWEREYREWYDKYYKSYSAQQSAQQNAQLRGRGPAKAYSPERFPPPRPRENSPYSRGRREDYPAQPRARAHVYPERYGAPAARAVSKDPPKNIKELEPKSLKPKKHRKKRKGEDGYGHSDSTDEARRDAKGDAATMNASRDDATPVRDEPMEGVSYKSSSDKDKKDRSKVRRKVESATSKEAPTCKSTKSTKDKDPPPVRDRTAPGEPPIKRIKEDPAQKPDDGRHAPPRKPVQSRSVRPKDEAKVEPKVKRESAKDEAKVEPKVKRDSAKDEAKVEPKVKRESAKDEAKVEPKVKRESTKEEAKVEPKVKRESTKEEAKVEPKVKRESTKDSSKMERVARPKAEKTTIKQSDTKPDTRRRKDEKPSQAPPPATPMKSPRAEPAEASRSSPKPKTRVEGEKAEKVSIPSLMDIKPEPARKIKLNREMARRVESTQESAARSHAQHKARLKVRRRVHGSDASGSTLVDYTSTSSTGGSPARRLEERAELRKTVVKTLEEYTHDSSTAAEDEIVFIQVPRSKWEKEDFDSEDDENKAPLLPPSSSAPDAERATPREPPPELRPPTKDPPAGDPEKERETERERGERAEPERRKPSSANQERGSEHGSERSSASSQPPKDRTSRKAPGRDPALDRKPEHRGRDQPDPRKPKEPIRRKDEPPPANKRVSQEPRGAERSPSGDRKKPPEGDTPRDTATPKSTQSTESKNDPDAKIKASQTRSARLPSDLTRETDESTFVPDYSESDSETSDADNNRAGPKDKPQESSPAHSPSPSGSHAHSSSPSSPGSQDSHKKKKDKKDKKEKKKEKKKHKNHKRHKKHKKHGTNESESEGGKAPKHKRKKKKSKKNKEKDKDERDDKSPQQ